MAGQLLDLNAGQDIPTILYTRGKLSEKMAVRSAETSSQNGLSIDLEDYAASKRRRTASRLGISPVYFIIHNTDTINQGQTAAR